MKRYLLLIPLLLAMIACEKEPRQDDGPDKEFTPIVLTKAEEGINYSVNDFGLKLYRSLYEEDQVFISPMSVSLALSMAAYGARETTEKEMIATLGFGDATRDQVGDYYKKMVPALTDADNRTALEIANSVWVTKAISLRPDYSSGVKDYFSADIFSKDFASKSLIDEINTWCSDKTHGLIKKLADEIDTRTVMILLNALYFSGKWSVKFDKAVNGKFKTLNSSSVSAKMMSKKDQYKYTASEGYQMVSIPYGNGAFVMDIILPETEGGDAFERAVKGLTWDVYSNLIHSGYTREVTITMPAFNMDYDVKLRDILAALGMPSAFNPFSANFSGITDDGIYIDQVTHKTQVEVNESGTEAAAVTAVHFFLTSAPSPITFTADRPFIFAIRETSTNALIFVGQKVK
ncbi:MAG: serpin family protein [Bacteroidales bacterium]|nr:serpin family protein [Bacteroidales bacterium]